MGTVPPAPRVVVVEDDPALGAMMRECLTAEGYQVELCREGERALTVIQATRPDLIILDVRMPGIGGLGVLYYLTTDPVTRAIPVLLCTAVSASEMEAWRDVLDQKGVSILFKPFALADLTARIEALLAGNPAGHDSGAPGEVVGTAPG